jgi:hypothetical protein
VDDTPQRLGSWEATKRELWVVHLVVAFFLGVPLVDLVSTLASPGTLGPDEAVTLIDVFLATAPLCVAFGGIAYLWFGGLTSPPALALAAGAILFAATQVGFRLGFHVPGDVDVDGGGVYGPSLAFLQAYFEFYGPALFGSAAVIGGYLGWKARQGSRPPA